MEKEINDLVGELSMMRFVAVAVRLMSLNPRRTKRKVRTTRTKMRKTMRVSQDGRFR